jgi:hypothetical protein
MYFRDDSSDLSEKERGKRGILEQKSLTGRKGVRIEE